MNVQQPSASSFISPGISPSRSLWKSSQTHISDIIHRKFRPVAVFQGTFFPLFVPYVMALEVMETSERIRFLHALTQGGDLAMGCAVLPKKVARRKGQGLQLSKLLFPENH